MLVTEVLQKMVKQRRESITLYEQGNRQELADAEKAEVEVIESFLPQQMSEAEAGEFGRKVWRTINLPNLLDNVLPTRGRADLILKKGKSHLIEDVQLRRV